ncbi:MAG TPA: DUF5678 domain-containing protein [Pyrinomonadaceae bacterium]|nr:DUF5678 domain-containing protein [Pyrinomonadaceae bacterium]
MTAANKEEAFAELVRQYEDMWVALIETDGCEHVVGHGSTAVEAANDAKQNGHSEPTLFKVPSFSSRFVY